jgi:hypothetical protein
MNAAVLAAALSNVAVPAASNTTIALAAAAAAAAVAAPASGLPPRASIDGAASEDGSGSDSTSSLNPNAAAFKVFPPRPVRTHSLETQGSLDVGTPSFVTRMLAGTVKQIIPATHFEAPSHELNVIL